MRGYRKLIALVFIGAIAAFVDLNEYQAKVLISLGTVYLGSNAVVHAVGVISGKVTGKNRVSGSGDSGSG